MTVFPWDQLTPSLFKTPVRLTIGVFDGLHIGHQKLMESITQGDSDAVPLVITFRSSPALYFAPATFSGFILSYQQKLSRLLSMGIGAALVIDFSEEMSNLSGRAFIRLLKENLTIQKIVVGYNFRFGKSRSTGNDDLREMLSGTETEVHVTEPVRWEGEIVSSSRIRAAIKDGQFESVRAMLGQDYCLDLRECKRVASPGGKILIARDSISQVVPRPGEYSVTYLGTEGAQSGRCSIDDTAVMLAAPESGEVTTVIFT